MIDFEDYEKNKGQLCLDKWMKVPLVKEELSKLANDKAMEVAVKLEDNRIMLFNKDGKDNFMNCIKQFIEDELR